MTLKAGLFRRFRQWLAETADHRLRYAEVLSLLEVERPERVLEVGSGPVGLARYWAGGVVGVDVAFPQPTAKGLRPTVAPATKLPFEDGTFPVVISIDMLEHLPAAERPKAIAEMIRVSKGTVIIAAPCGPAARKAEAALIKNWVGPLPDWLSEHQASGLPEIAEIRQAITDAASASGKRVRVNERPGGDCDTWLTQTQSLNGGALSRILKQRWWLLRWPSWQGKANRGEPYRMVFVCRFSAAPAPVGAAQS